MSNKNTLGEIFLSFCFEVRKPNLKVTIFLLFNYNYLDQNIFTEGKLNTDWQSWKMTALGSFFGRHFFSRVKLLLLKMKNHLWPKTESNPF